MQFFSTRDRNRVVSASQAIAQGLSDEGGLFVPQSFPQVDVQAICGLEYPEMAAAIVGQYLTDYSQQFLAEAAKATYGEAFGGKAGYLAPVSDSVYSLELWHGPTCAFKDYALQLMPKLLVEAKKNLNRTEKTLILVATSGDTGKAALDGYHDIPGVEIAVFFPTGGTSEIQRLQMATQEGENVAVYAVRGNFDDAQTGVKRIFSDEAIRAELDRRGFFLSSANSINWGRILPQVVYYISAYCDLVRDHAIAMGDKVNFCVPTGNFGDILAAYYAKRMGLPVGKLICASNSNNVLTDFINTGVYNRKRPFHKTISPSMDILVSSNLERLVFEETDHNAVQVAEWMKELNEKGEYKIGTELQNKILKDFFGTWVDEVETRETIGDVYNNYGYVMDPHTAVAYKAMEKYRLMTGDETYSIVLSTASPFKFNDVVLASIDPDTYEGKALDPFVAMDDLSRLAKMPIPAGMQELSKLQKRQSDVVDKTRMEAEVKKLLGLE